VSVIDTPDSILPKAKYSREIKAVNSGYISYVHIDEAEMVLSDAYIVANIEDKNIKMAGKVYDRRIIALL
jgi:hypothetical protein